MAKWDHDDLVSKPMKGDPDDLVGHWDALKPQKEEAAAKPAAARSGILDVNELRTATQRAIQDGTAKKRAAEEAKVADILQRTTERARKEAAKGKSQCRVMKILYDRDYTYVKDNTTRPRRIELLGLAKLVSDQLQAAKIQTDFERQNTGGSYFDEDVWLLMKW